MPEPEKPREPPAEEPEPTLKLAVEETEELAPESPTQEAEEPTPEPVVDETEELVAEQTPAQKTDKTVSKPGKLAFRGLFKKRRQKEKEKESVPEPEFLKILILPVTLASMLLGLSIMPLFPQPLPAILAFLIAFLTYKIPGLGMPIGGLTVGLGLMYNLSKMNFISMLGSPEARGAFVFVLLFLFTALPVIFHSRKAAISINLGIIAAILLFFSETYFLAIPLIFTAVVLFKEISFLTVIYYASISVPLQVMQYLNLVLPIERWDWWIEPGTSPPILVPLTEIFTDVQESMLQFRLYDTSKVVYSITEQITSDPPVMQHTVLEMLSHYLDSLPGIILFLFMVIGIVSALVFFTRSLLAKSNISHGERLLPTISATVGVALFFLLATSLQVPLAFRVDIDGAQMAIATFATVLFTLPAFLMGYTPLKKATVNLILEKVKELKTKLQIFEDELYEVKSSLPISCGPFEVKTLMVRDKLNDILRKTSTRSGEASVDKIFNELDSLSPEIDNLTSELYVLVGEYQIFANCEWSKWVGMFNDIGLETDVTVKTAFQKEAPLEERIDQVKEVLEAGRSLANEVIEVAKQVYEVIRSFYDRDLPKENHSIAFAQKRLAEKAAPWTALNALFASLNNWYKQYKVQIFKSVDSLQKALSSIADLSTKNERILSVLGYNLPVVLENAKRTENIKIDVEENAFNIIDVLTIREIFQSPLSVVREVLSILYEELKSKEKAIEILAPSEEFVWEKNDGLMKRLVSAIEITSESSEVKLSQVLESLPKFLSYIDECAETIAFYNRMEKILPNYPIAEKTIENLFREKKRISAKDLPFGHKYAEEYLKLFYSQKFREYSLDKTNMLLTKKT